MDGLELLRRLRQAGDLPVIFLTSKDEEIDELMGLNAGADDYIRKPFSQRLLLERVKAVLRRNEGNKQVAGTTGPVEPRRGRRGVAAWEADARPRNPHWSVTSSPCPAGRLRRMMFP